MSTSLMGHEGNRTSRVKRPAETWVRRLMDNVYWWVSPAYLGAENPELEEWGDSADQREKDVSMKANLKH